MGRVNDFPHVSSSTLGAFVKLSAASCRKVLVSELRTTAEENVFEWTTMVSRSREGLSALEGGTDNMWAPIPEPSCARSSWAPARLTLLSDHNVPLTGTKQQLAILEFSLLSASRSPHFYSIDV